MYGSQFKQVDDLPKSAKTVPFTKNVGKVKYFNGYQPEPMSRDETNALIEAVRQETYETHMEKLWNVDSIMGYRGTKKKLMVKNTVVDGFAEFISRQASYIVPDLLMQRFAPIRFRDALPINGAGGWSKYFITSLMTFAGNAETSSEVANGFTKTKVGVNERIDVVIPTKHALEWEYGESKALEQFAPNITTAAMKMVQQNLEYKARSIVLDGEPGKYGLLTDPNILRITAPAGASGKTQWKFKTPDERLADMQMVYAALNQNSEGAFNARTFYMSNYAYNQTVGVPRSAFSDSTVEKYAVDNLPDLQLVVPDPFLDGRGASNPTTSSELTNIIVAMDPDPDNFRVYIPIEMSPYPVEYQGGNIIMPYTKRICGFVLIQAPSIIILEGI